MVRKKRISFNHFRAMINSIKKDLIHRDIITDISKRIGKEQTIQDELIESTYNQVLEIEVENIIYKLLEDINKVYKKHPFKKGTKIDFNFSNLNVHFIVSYMFCKYNKNSQLARVSVDDSEYILFRVNLKFNNAKNEKKVYKKLFKI